jgi:hypothetical protein
MMNGDMMTGEAEPQPTIEERALVRLGYEHCLDTPLEEGAPTVGRYFLDAYGNSPKRQDTEDLLRGFVDMDEADPDYPATRTYITRFIEPYFGSPQEG